MLVTLTNELTRPLSAIALAIAVASVPACGKFQKSANVNQPAQLTKLPSHARVLTPVFSRDGAGKLSLKNNHLLSRKQKVELQQSPNAFRVVADTQGLVTASANGNVTAVNANGKEVWRATLSQGLAGGVAVDSQATTVVVSDPYGKLIALDRMTGKQRWQSQLNSSVLAPTLIAGNRVISLTNSGIITAVSLQTGEKIWEFATQNPSLSVRGSSTPVLLDATTALVSTADGRIHAINLDNGVPLWSHRMSNAQGASDIQRLADIDATPVINNNLLYVTSYSGQLVAIDMANRELAFVKQKDYASIKPVGVDESQLYVTTLNGNVVALNKLNGEVNWESDALHFRGLSNAIAVNDYVLVGDALGYLHAFDKSTGKVIDRAEVGRDIANLQLTPHGVIATSENGGFSVWQVGH